MEKNRKRGERTERHIAVVNMINKICAGENTSRDTSEEPQEPQKVKMATFVICLPALILPTGTEAN